MSRTTPPIEDRSLRRRVARWSRECFGLLGGLSATWRRWRNKASSKVEDEAVFFERHRGRHRLLAREDGSPRCTSCALCVAVCPSDCIVVVPEDAPELSLERRPVKFEINDLACVVCGFCVEACPVDALRMDTRLHPAIRSRPDQAWSDLLAGLEDRESEGRSS